MLRRTLVTMLALLGLLAVGCSDDEVVYQDRPPFNEPADPAAGFLGYYTSSAKQTTCGNCHADFQGTW